MYHWEVNIGGVEFHVDLFVDERLAVFVVVLPDPGHGHPDLDWAAFFRRRRNRDKAGGWGEDLGLSLESLGQRRGFWGVARVTLCYWTGLRSPRLVPPLSYQLPSLHNYTPDETHYEMCPNLKRYSCHITGLSICTSSFQCTFNYFILLLKSALFSWSALDCKILKGLKRCPMVELQVSFIHSLTSLVW